MTRAEACKSFIADLSRPFALYAVSVSTAVAILRIAWKGTDLPNGAVFITAALGGLAALYGAKAWENAKQGQATAEVEKAKVAAGPAADPDEIPPAQRLKA